MAFPCPHHPAQPCLLLLPSVCTCLAALLLTPLPDPVLCPAWTQASTGPRTLTPCLPTLPPAWTQASTGPRTLTPRLPMPQAPPELQGFLCSAAEVFSSGAAWPSSCGCELPSTCCGSSQAIREADWLLSNSHDCLSSVIFPGCPHTRQGRRT